MLHALTTWDRPAVDLSRGPAAMVRRSEMCIWGIRPGVVVEDGRAGSGMMVGSMRLRLVLWRQSVWADFERAGLPCEAVEPICRHQPPLRRNSLGADSPIARAASSLLPMRTVPYPLLLLSGPKLTSARSTVPAFRNRSFKSCQRTR